MRRLVLVLAGLALAGPGAATRDAAPRPPTSEVVPAPRRPAVRSLLVGGGSQPGSNHVSLEQDLALAAEVLPRPAVILFGGGEGSKTVQELLSDSPAGDPLLAELAGLFDPRPRRLSCYRTTRLEAQPATAANVKRELTAALATGSDPLYLFVAAHGDQGETPAASRVSLWGDTALSVEQLARLHDESLSERPLRLVVASCFSGSFGELVFKSASVEEGPARKERCGLFASTWDTESSGCDSNPQRSQQESYSLHLLRALAGLDRHARPLPTRAIDLDGDGRVSLLEAHTRARIAAASIDVPTTTSEDYLRHVVPDGAPIGRPVSLPEEEAVIAALGSALGLANEPAVLARLDRLDAALSRLDGKLGAAEQQLDRDRLAVALALLERWPLLDDPWHPGFRDELASGRKAIAKQLADSPEAAAYRRDLKRVKQLTARWEKLELGAARALRLARAWQTQRLAGQLKVLGGANWDRYRQILRCERSVP